MAKKLEEKTPMRKKRDETAKEIARLARCSTSYVRKVMNGDRESEEILTATILYQQGKSKLLKSIEQLVPFN